MSRIRCKDWKVKHPDAYSAAMAATKLCIDRQERMGYWRAYFCEDCGSHHVGRDRIPRRDHVGSDPELLMWGEWRLVIANLRENQSRLSARQKYITGLAWLAEQGYTGG